MHQEQTTEAFSQEGTEKWEAEILRRFKASEPMTIADQKEAVRLCKKAKRK